MLLIFGGLPASGKSTLSKFFARELNAVHLRVDTVEQTLKDTGFINVHSEGYDIAYSLAADNLFFVPFAGRCKKTGVVGLLQVDDAQTSSSIFIDDSPSADTFGTCGNMRTGR